MRRATIVAVLLAFAASGLAQETKPATQEAQVPPPATQPSSPDTVRVKLTTTLGDIVLELDAAKAPISTHNFVRYVDAKFYEGKIFHRVMKDFMIQGGGYTPEMDEPKAPFPPIKNEWRNGLKNVRGTIAMARTQVADSATAQFFINVVDNPMLDTPRDGAAYAVFGKVVEGMDVVDEIRNTEVVTHAKYPSPQAVVPKKPVIILSAEVLGNVDRAKLAGHIEAAEKAAREAEAKVAAEREKEVQDYLKKLEQEKGKKPEKTASGIYYVIVKEGSGESPKPTDTVEVHYTGTLLNGSKFDSSRDRGQPTRFPLNRVIRGWTEGVGLMKPGEQRILVIPPELAYGARPPTPLIPPNSWLVFDVELLKVNPAQ
ncbi:MAG: peptidylprolyl isomerase [Planctomycetota bacterium]